MLNRLGLTASAAALVLVLAGCGNYTIQFDVADVINASEGKPSGDQLPVDIVCVTSDEASKYPDLVDGRLRSDKWFERRMNNDPQLPAIPASRLYSLRPEIERLQSTDTRRGDSLVGAKYRSDGKRTVEVSIEHPQPGNGKAAIVIYAWFKEQGRSANKPPLVIKPPGMFGPKTLQIRVGASSLECANCP